MKPFVRGMLITGALAMGANGLFAGQFNTTSNGWFEQWHKAKFGRNSPAEEARLKADRETTAFREEFTPEVAGPANTWFEQYYRGKYGRNSPAEEARLNAARESTAFREESVPKAAGPANTWVEQYYKGKYGRNSPMAEAK